MVLSCRRPCHADCIDCVFSARTWLTNRSTSLRSSTCRQQTVTVTAMVRMTDTGSDMNIGSTTFQVPPNRAGFPKRAWHRPMTDDSEACTNRSQKALAMKPPTMPATAPVRVARFQYRQVEPGVCTLLVVAAPGFDNADRIRIEKAYRDKLGNELDMAIELVGEIPLTDRGKLRRIVRD